ncbi:lipid A export permease/ATP-binding protein MsbA [Thiolapillus brandeum]|uniref:Lipid A ABC exporter ATP-binding protein / permease n=1 Tax=Thiolapillus brandeum TaxID=1076588 RepID=A0A7U6GG98_9GAMM|nr:lipid A export permease/ATP-binding protein MsbA [Thiolapillus brandeum]BAO43066.1 lipid A ABC exporter ATP-binding protein / permease [Thiolapillus brandeum]
MSRKYRRPHTTFVESKELYLRLLKHVRPYWQVFALAILFIVILALTEPAIPILMKPLMDGAFVEKDETYMFWVPIWLLLLFLIRGVSNFISRVAFQWVSGMVVLDLRREMFERILTLPVPFFDAHATGNLIAKVTYDVTQVTTAATRVLIILLRDSLSIVGLLGYMVFLNWRFTLVVSIMLPVMLAFVRFISARMRRSSRELQETMGEMTHALEEATRGNKIVKVYGGENYERRRFFKLANWVRRYRFKLKVADATSVPVVEFIGAIMIAVLIYLGTGQVDNEAMTVGEFTGFFTAMGLLFAPIKRLTAINQPLQTGLAGAESVFNLVDEVPEKDTGTRELTEVKGAVRFEDVGFRYAQAEGDALNGISFSIEPGQSVALVGPSGSGKTTIAALIPRFYEPTSGHIRIDDIPLDEIRLGSLRSQIAYVGQESILFNDSVAANISYGASEPPDRETLEAAARAAHALDFIRELPEGFDTMVGEDGVRLSGGQRQRIAIARALLKDAPILILDEATSALDTVSERHVQAALQNLTRNRTTLIIAHRLSTIENADVIMVVSQGRIVESGAHQELMARGGEYAHLYNNQIVLDEKKVKSESE